MHSRRKAPLYSGATPALQPIPEAQQTTFDKDVQIEQLRTDLRRLQSLLAQERKRNVKIERLLVRQLDSLTDSLASIKVAYVEQLQLKPTGTKQ